MRDYVPTLQDKTKWRVTRNNICHGQLVEDAESISKRGTYRLCRLHQAHQLGRKGKMLVRGATVAVLKDFTDVTNKIEYILGDLLKMPPVKFFYRVMGFGILHLWQHYCHFLCFKTDSYPIETIQPNF